MAEQPIAVGREADVFEAGPGRVLRRCRDPQRSCELEADVMRHARAAGYPVPEVFDAAGPEILMERVEGTTMLADIGRRPWTMFRHARTLADLHRRLHAIAPPEWLPAPYGAGPSLLHRDLHPDNVLLTAEGPVVIDWTGACAGPGAADVARTWVIVTTSIPDSGPTLAVVRAGQRWFGERFLRAAGDRDAVLATLPVIGPERRLDPNLRPEEDRAIVRLLARHGHVQEPAP